MPAISTWGSRSMSPMMFRPPMSRPRAKAVLDLCSTNSRDSITSRISTGVTFRLGTSIPTTEILSGMGAIRTPLAPRARGDVVRQIRDLGELHALVQGELVPGDGGAVDHIAGGGVHAEAGEGLRQTAGVVPQLRAGLGVVLLPALRGAA